MNKGAPITFIAFFLLAALVVAFFSFFAVVRYPVEMCKPLKLPGETYFLVRKPNITDPVFVNAGQEMNGVVWGGILNLLMLKSANVPWYVDRDYISKNVFFCYNTVAGVVLDKKFFERASN